MGNYGITGWSGGGRRPITNNLRAGQFRQMGVPRNVSSKIFINNNFGCSGSYNSAYFDGCCGNNDSGMSKFEKWMMGLGIGGGLLGVILGAFGKGKSEGAGDTNEEQPQNLNKQLMEPKNEPAVETTAPTAQQTTSTETATVTETLPKLFNETGMRDLATVENVLSKFKSVTNTDAYKIDTSSSSGITINQVNDSGNKTKVSGSITISAEQLNSLKSGTWTNLGKFHDKNISATNLDGYLQIKVGDQTYIVGKTSDNKYQGYQFENGNVEGYSKANWTRRR